MDERLEKALEFSNYRMGLFQRKEDLKLAIQNALTYAYNGGIFKISRELINFVKLIIDEGKQRAVLIDSNGNPIEIIDLHKFYEDAFDKYFEATNLYHDEYTRLKSARSVASIYQFVEAI